MFHSPYNLMIMGSYHDGYAKQLKDFYCNRRAAETTLMSVLLNAPRELVPTEPPAAAKPVFYPVEDEQKPLSLEDILNMSDRNMACDFLSDDEASETAPASSEETFLPSQTFSVTEDKQKPLSPEDILNMSDRMMACNFLSDDEASEIPETATASFEETFHPSQIFSVTEDEVQVVEQLPTKKRNRFELDLSSDDFDDEEEDDAQSSKANSQGQWNLKYEELLQYKEQNGHSMVPHAYPENPTLGRWVKRQRYQYKRMQQGRTSAMTPERVALLEDVGFIWDCQGTIWEERLVELAAFRDTFGHCNVPSLFEGNPKLATWVKSQRRQYRTLRDGQPSTITPERIERLENLGFVFDIRRSMKKARMDLSRADEIVKLGERKMTLF